MKGEYQVSVTRETAGYDDYGVPCVAKVPTRVEIAASRRELMFADRAALQQFIDACVNAGDEAFGVRSNEAITEIEKATWRRFFSRF